MSQKARRAPRVEDLRPHELTILLTRLARRNGAVGSAVREEIERLVASVDAEQVAGDVAMDLAGIDDDEITHRSGDDRYGYTAPYDAASEVLEETMRPYVERLGWYHDAGRLEACDAYALGVLRVDDARKASLIGHRPARAHPDLRSLQRPW